VVSTLSTLQSELKPWTLHNFGERPSWQPLLGALEELGELAHAHLKGEQGIRGTTEEHAAAARDAIGDVVVYLADYCNARGFDMDEIVRETWAQVCRRDWKANSRDGSVEQPCDSCGHPLIYHGQFDGPCDHLDCACSMFGRAS
jgi:NTP pyrophosphatase (non-canonical NTP hydrolase)